MGGGPFIGIFGVAEESAQSVEGLLSAPADTLHAIPYRDNLDCLYFTLLHFT